MSKQTLSAIYKSTTAAENAIRTLKAKGFKDRELSLLVSKNSNEKNIKLDANTKAPEGISIGASVGGALGATVAGLTTVGAVTLTGGATLLAAGPIVAALAGAGAGATIGGLTGGLIGLGMPETEAKIVDERLSTGNVLIGVSINDENKSEIKSLLKNTGAEQVTVH